MGQHTAENLTAGIDVGSAGVKVVVARSRAGADGDLLSTSLQRIRRRELLEVVEAAFAEALAAAGVRARDLDYVATTGEADAVEFRSGHFYNMTTHARGAVFLVPEATAAVDVGALHARAIKMDPRGKVLAHRMTSQCASGTGQFLENIARYLGVSLEDVGDLSSRSEQPEAVSSICAVLAETDVINMVSRGVRTEDILKGIHLSVAGRLVQLVRGVGAAGVVAVTGGLSQDVGLLAAMREQLASGGGRKRSALQLLDVEFVSHPQAVYAGAIGAALLGAWRCEHLKRRGEEAGAPARA